MATEELIFCQRSNLRVPACLAACINFLEFSEDRMLTEGLYRLAGGKKMMTSLRTVLVCEYGDQWVDPGVPDAPNVNSVWSKVENVNPERISSEDIHVVANVTKVFFREMIPPLITFDLYQEVLQLAEKLSTIRVALRGPGNDWNIPENARSSLYEEASIHITPILCKLSRPRRDIFRFFLSHLQRISLFRSQNKMTTSNLSIVVSPNFIRPQVETSETLMRFEDSNIIFDVLIQVAPGILSEMDSGVNHNDFSDISALELKRLNAFVYAPSTLEEEKPRSEPRRLTLENLQNVGIDLEMTPAVHMGYLNKKTDARSSKLKWGHWNLRYFVLWRNGKFAYFENSQEYFNGKKPKLSRTYYIPVPDSQFQLTSRSYHFGDSATTMVARSLKSESSKSSRQDLQHPFQFEVSQLSTLQSAVPSTSASEIQSQSSGSVSGKILGSFKLRKSNHSRSTTLQAIPTSKKFILAASSQTELQRWIEALNAVAQGRPLDVEIRSVSQSSFSIRDGHEEARRSHPENEANLSSKALTKVTDSVHEEDSQKVVVQPNDAEITGNSQFIPPPLKEAAEHDQHKRSSIESDSYSNGSDITKEKKLVSFADHVQSREISNESDESSAIDGKLEISQNSSRIVDKPSILSKRFSSLSDNDTIELQARLCAADEELEYLRRVLEVVQKERQEALEKVEELQKQVQISNTRLKLAQADERTAKNKARKAQADLRESNIELKALKESLERIQPTLRTTSSSSFLHSRHNLPAEMFNIELI